MTRLPMTVLRAAALTVGFLVTLPAILALSAWEWWHVWQKGLREDGPKEFDREASFADWGQVMSRGRATQAKEERS